VTCEKLKDGEEWRPLALALVESGGSLVLARADAETDDLAERILAFIAANGPVSKNQIRRGVEGRAERIDAEREALRTRGVAEKTSQGWQVCPQPAGHAGAHPTRGRRRCVPHAAPLRRRGRRGHASRLGREAVSGTGEWRPTVTAAEQFAADARRGASCMTPARIHPDDLAAVIEGTARRRRSARTACDGHSPRG
jgi:hypothetical protein